MAVKRIRKLCKKSKIITKVYRIITGTPNPSTGLIVDVPEVGSVNPRRLDELGDELRLNLIIPSINKKHVFGGISTAITFFNNLASVTKAKIRIITTDCSINLSESINMDGYVLVDCDSNSVENNQLVSFADRYNKTIPVGKNDIFIATAWWTAYNFASVIKWQKIEYNTDMRKLIYLIQDYEPCFYPWSSRYLMADSTYRSDVPTIAVFNSKQLKEYFDINNYEFDTSYYFEPTLNETLKNYLLKKSDRIFRKKQIIVYGRPSVQRNAFELVIASLKKWVELYDKASEWIVYSVGESHEPIGLGKKIVLKSMGKLTLEEYANTMLETYMALSLMVSPHPSYPPLEMSTFGIKTITNTYANKNLKLFNENIISLSNCSADAIAKEMVILCNNFKSDTKPILDYSYIDSKNVFQNICLSINDAYLSKLN